MGPRLARGLAVVALVLGAAAASAPSAPALEAQGHGPGHDGPQSFVVTTVAPTGPGSLAAAIESVDADECGQGERDHIVFEVAGAVETVALPALTSPVDLDATGAPGYAAGAPVVGIAGGGGEVGLTVGPGASGSRIAGLAISGFGTGIVVDADRTTIVANLIAHNSGAGIRVEPGARETTIRGNSIFDNGARGIEVPPGGDAPPRPELTGFFRSAAATAVTGAFTGEPEATYALEFFASEACLPSGQGQTFLGILTVTTGATGEAAFEATALAPLPAAAKFITATATGGAGRSTSEFSACLGEPERFAPAEIPTLPAAALPTPEPSAAAALPGAIVPINGQTVTIEPKSGKVRVKTPGDTRFRPLTDLESIPIGSLVDTTEGKARIASADAGQGVQSASFLGGVFRVLQVGGRTLTTMRLFDSEFEPCSAPAEAASASATGSGPNHLWGSGKGNFRTEGSFGSATVRGTIWFVADRCGSTFFKVNRGIVTIRDFPHARTLALRAGGSYTAAP